MDNILDDLEELESYLRDNDVERSLEHIGQMRAQRTSFDYDLAVDLELDQIDERVYKSASGREKRSVVELPLELNGRGFVVEANVADRSNMSYDVLIGRDILQYFFVNP